MVPAWYPGESREEQVHTCDECAAVRDLVQDVPTRFGRFDGVNVVGHCRIRKGELNDRPVHHITPDQQVAPAGGNAIAGVPWGMAVQGNGLNTREDLSSFEEQHHH